MADPSVQILVVDDEQALLRLITGYLTRLGYSVAGVATAGEAMESFAKDPFRFTLAVVDLSLPDRQGDDLAIEMMRINPQLRTILCSGYVTTDQVFPPEMRPRVGILQKPFLPNMLLSEIQRLLSA
jgi:DNA-binding NtrC family response regulator